MEQVYTLFPSLVELSKTENIIFMKKMSGVGTTGQNADALTYTKWSCHNPPTLQNLMEDKVLTRDIKYIHLAIGREIEGYPGRLRYLTRNFGQYKLETEMERRASNHSDICCACQDLNSNKIRFSKHCGHVICIPCVIGFHCSLIGKYIHCPSCNALLDLSLFDRMYFKDRRWDDYYDDAEEDASSEAPLENSAYEGHDEQGFDAVIDDENLHNHEEEVFNSSSALVNLLENDSVEVDERNNEDCSDLNNSVTVLTYPTVSQQPKEIQSHSFVNDNHKRVRQPSLKGKHSSAQSKPAVTTRGGNKKARTVTDPTTSSSSSSNSTKIAKKTKA